MNIQPIGIRKLFNTIVFYLQKYRVGNQKYSFWPTKFPIFHIVPTKLQIVRTYAMQLSLFFVFIALNSESDAAWVRNMDH